MAADPVGRFAAEAEEARTRVTSTIDEIQDRLDPRRIVGDAVDRVSGGGMQLAGQARDLAKAHPLALAAAIGAIGLALLARNKLNNATVNLGDDLGDYTDYDDGFGFAETQPTRMYFDEDGDADDVEPTPPVRRVRRVRVKARAGAMAARAGESVDANPLVAIIAGLAAGAALGAMFPATEAERRALGETGGKLGAAARAAARRASDELAAAGLSVESVRAKAGEASRKAKAAAQSVVDAARDEFKG
nr:DUF3618 domain-containing protein [Polymorphobacter sp.]